MSDKEPRWQQDAPIIDDEAANRLKSSNEQTQTDPPLPELDLLQSQIAVLLGISPQMVSRGIRDDKDTLIGFLSKERRAQRLYSALMYIGGDRFALSATRLKEIGARHGWSFEEPLASIRPAELYDNANELWVVSDSPGKHTDWPALKSMMFSESSRDRHKVVVFFLSTLEAAEDWAEVLERAAIQPAIGKDQIAPDKGRRFGVYVYLVVTNLTPYSGDFTIANPGSVCMSLFTNKLPGMYYWHQGVYVQSPVNTGFIRVVHRYDLGKSTEKANFFPHGVRLTKEVINFPPAFIDGLIAIRGKTAKEDDSADGNSMAGGILREPFKQPPETQAINKTTKFCPYFLLAYKRKPGDSYSRRTQAQIQSELDRQKESDGADLGQGGIVSGGFFPKS